MVRVLASLATLALVAAIALLVAKGGGALGPAVGLLLVSVLITAALGVRRAYLMGRTFLGDARAFLSGDVQRARLVDIEDPRGIFRPTSAAVFELEGEDGHVHRFEREIPVPFFTAWGYRAAKRLPVPAMPRERLVRLLSVELRREGLRLSIGRPEAPAPEPSP